MLPCAAAVELEQVHPCLLLPPHEPGGAVSVLAGGGFEPGDRVVVLRGTGSPAFGARGTVIGVLADAVEVLMDDEYAGVCAHAPTATTLHHPCCRWPAVVHAQHMYVDALCGSVSNGQMPSKTALTRCWCAAGVLLVRPCVAVHTQVAPLWVGACVAPGVATCRQSSCST